MFLLSSLESAFYKWHAEIHKNAYDHATILWPRAKEKVRSSGHEPMGLHVNTFTVGAHLRGLEGLQALSREAKEKPQPPCLGSEEKEDFSSVANTVPKASTHYWPGELATTRQNWNQGGSAIQNMAAEEHHRNIQTYLSLHKNMCIWKAAVNLHS